MSISLMEVMEFYSVSVEIQYHYTPVLFSKCPILSALNFEIPQPLSH